jgi:hypothetical protein
MGRCRELIKGKFCGKDSVNGHVLCKKHLTALNKKIEKQKMEIEGDFVPPERTPKNIYSHTTKTDDPARRVQYSRNVQRNTNNDTSGMIALNKNN